MIYIAGPYDLVDEESEVNQLRDALREMFAARNVPTFDPTLPYAHAGFAPQATRDINNAAVRACSGLVAICSDDTPSIGTPMEIQIAHDFGKPVVAVGGGHKSMQLKAMGIPAFWDPIDAVETIIAKTTGQPPRTIKWTGEDDFQPRFGYEGDAGLDLIVSENTTISVGAVKDVPHGVSIELPPGLWALLIGRSSTLRKRGLHAATSVIDNGYRGPLWTAVQNTGQSKVELKRGERISQLIPLRLETTDLSLYRVAELSDSERGERSFGSSGG